MGRAGFLHFFVGILACFCVLSANADDPYRFYTWIITYGTISPLGVSQQGILINGQFPGPPIECVTNDNIIINVINNLDEPFLITWNGIKQRKNSWQDGVLGTNCPIPPNSNYTYAFQVKDQIGTYTYFPSTSMHRAAGAFGAFNIQQRSVIPIPYPMPVEEFTLLVGDWYTAGHKELQQILDSGYDLPYPNGLLINGQKTSTFTGQPGELYKFRISNVGLTTSINFRIQDHNLTLVEVEGSHTLQGQYDSLDIHVGQSVAVLVTLNKPVKDYFIVASTRFKKPILNATAVLHYDGSSTPASGEVPPAPGAYHWSMEQARSIRWNLTANAARPNPQGSYHYGTIPLTRRIILGNSQSKINGLLRYAVNRISYINPTTPLKLADYFSIPGVFDINTIQDKPSPGPTVLGTSVINTTLHDFVEIVFQNDDKYLQSWHLDGYDFWTVGFGSGSWDDKKTAGYNLRDAPTRNTVQVYPQSWTAILVSLDNKGMWNLRSAIWPRRYLGQELYVRVWDNVRSLYTEYNIPPNALLCGKAENL
ncbi:Multicopper oxidase, C-terminal [Dillenia turbinata]|uniref:Multicopper oxidase, C-terminal n=1 Tax=Dillenia turbinata TaxID=194707 RepID=A0AAN8UY74_9MAGN